MTILIFITINIIACIIGYIATESKYRLVEYIPTLNFKPFNCKPCFTFHSIWILQGIVALIIGSWIYFIIAVITALLIFFILWVEDKLHIQP